MRETERTNTFEEREKNQFGERVDRDLAIWLTVGAEFSSRGPTEQKERLFRDRKKQEVQYILVYQGLPETMTPQPCFSGVIILVLYLTSSNQATRFEGKAEEATIYLSSAETEKNNIWRSQTLIKKQTNVSFLSFLMLKKCQFNSCEIVNSAVITFFIFVLTN